MEQKREFADVYEDVMAKVALVQREISTFTPNEKGIELLGNQSTHPESFSHPQVTRIALPFMGFDVNVWVYSREEKTILVDFGTKGTLLKALEREGISPTHYLVTHEDVDHIGGLPEVIVAYPEIKELASLCCRISTPGHREVHDSFYFPEEGICFCGDALFSGSMGRPRVGAGLSLDSVRTLMGLPEETLLFPGHGPATSVAWERENNCFWQPISSLKP